MKNQTSAALAWGGVLCAGVLWGVGAVVAQQVLAQGMQPLGLALARFALGLPLLWWWHLRQASAPRWCRLPWRERALIAGTGAVMALNVTCWFVAIGHIGAALPTVVSVCCAPLFVALVSLVRGYERASLRLGLALLLALAGVALVAVPAAGLATGKGWARGHLAGLAWSLGSALCYALVVLGNARMPGHLPAASVAAWSMTAAALCMLAAVVPTGFTAPAHAWGWLGVAYTGVVTTSVAYLCFAWGARRLAPTAVVMGTLVEPLVAAVLVAWLLAEPLAPRQWLGGLLLGAAMVVLSRRALAAGPSSHRV